MPVSFLGRQYRSPVWVASGTFGWGVEAYQGGFMPVHLGALVTKGVSPENIDGAPHPRIAEISGSSAVLNAIGLQNPGVVEFLGKYGRFYSEDSFTWPVWVNVFATSEAGFREVVQKCEAQENSWLVGYELNVSCPNVDKGGSEFASDTKTLSFLIAGLKKLTKRPIMVKMSPMAIDAVAIARVCKDAGADALSVTNTLLAAFPEPEIRKWSLGRRYGGMSGPALKPLALRLIDQIAQKVEIPLCGIGGICTAHDVREFMSAGAQVVQVGTANFANPWIVDDICQDLL